MTISRSKKGPEPRASSLPDLIRLWEKNVDIHVAQENLKHARIAHFIPIQLAIGAGVGFSTHEWLGSDDAIDGTIWFILSSALQVFAAYQAISVAFMDRRAANYIKLAKIQNRDLERRIFYNFRQNGLSKSYSSSILTYTRQYRRFGPKAFKRKTDKYKQFSSVHRLEQSLIMAAFVMWCFSIALHISAFLIALMY